MFVPTLFTIQDVMSQSGYNDEQVFDLGISGLITFYVVVPELGACRVSNTALSHFMAGVEQYEAEAMPEYYSGSLSGKWCIKRDRLRILPESWHSYSRTVAELVDKLEKQTAEEKNQAEKQEAGRYTIKEAADLIASNLDERPEELISKLKAEVASGSLTAYEPNKKQKYRFGGDSIVRDSYEEIYWNDLNTWLAKNEPRISFTFPNPYTSLRSLIKPHLENDFTDLPEPIRSRISGTSFFKMHNWDALSSAQRDSLAQQYDVQHDPSLEGERAYEWFEVTLGASYWWNLPSVEPLQAAILFVGLNPHETNEDKARQITTDETKPEDFKKLLVAFNALQRVDSKPRKLSEWLKYAKEAKLTIHSWIENWKLEHERNTPVSERQMHEDQDIASVSMNRELAKTKNQIDETSDGEYVPRNAIGKLTIEAAKEIEFETKRRATDKEVMTRLQSWADAGTKPATLKTSTKDKRGVIWITDKGAEKEYGIEACRKTLGKWLKS